MLNDAKDLQAVYIVCGYTDLRKGIDSLLNIISQTYGMDPFQPELCLCSVDVKQTGSRHLYGKVMDFYSVING